MPVMSYAAAEIGHARIRAPRARGGARLGSLGSWEHQEFNGVLRCKLSKRWPRWRRGTATASSGGYGRGGYGDGIEHSCERKSSWAYSDHAGELGKAREGVEVR